MNKILNKFRIKRKKGFTLIELLAVIIILSILIVLATSQVIKHVKTAKRKAFLTKANQVLKAANSAEVDDGAIVEKTYKFPDDRTLDLKWFPEAGYVMRDSYGKYKVSIWDDKLELCFSE